MTKKINPIGYERTSRDAAKQLVEGLMSADLPDEVRKEIQRWFKSEISEDKKYDALEKIFSGLEQDDRYDEYVERCLDEQHRRLGLAYGIEKQHEAKWRIAEIFSRNILFRVAAVMIPIFILYGTFVLTGENESGGDNMEIIHNTIIAEAGPDKQVVLPDSTQITLADGALVRYGADFENRREVYIEGEAFFSVTHDPDRPFIVHTNSITVTVYGTEFQVKAYADTPIAEVKLAAGSVSVTADGIEETMLVPGQHFVYDRSHRTISLDYIGEGEILRLMKKGLRLDGHTLDDSFRMMSQYFGTPIRVDPAIDLTERVAISFEDDVKLEEALSLLKIISKTNFDYKIEKDTVTLTRRR